VKIRFANDYKTPGGRTYKAGSVHEIKDNAEARRLIHRGKAVDAAIEVSDPNARGNKAMRGSEKQDPGNVSREETSATAETPTKTPPAKGKGKE
jgi:hypothetical protein